VGDNTASVWNNGYRGSQQDVILYANAGFDGRAGHHCVTRGDWGALPVQWINQVSSFRWVTHAECLRAGVFDLTRAG
jgi:hypothetical protein